MFEIRRKLVLTSGLTLREKKHFVCKPALNTKFCK